MAKVTELTIKLQGGTTNTYVASWKFGGTTTSNPSTTPTTSSTIKKGSLVTIKSGATYYNGVSIPQWVTKLQWYIVQVSGDRAVLGKDKSGNYNIQSPINTKHIAVVGSSGSGSGSGSGSSSPEDPAKTLDHYKVSWYYDTGDGIWFKANESDVKVKNDLYTPPEHALKIKVTVKPVSKTYKKNGKDTKHWTGENVSKTLNLASAPPDTPGVPNVEFDQKNKLKLIATVNFDPEGTVDPETGKNSKNALTDKIEFQVYDDTKGKTAYSGVVTVKACRATYTCTVAAGGSYKIRCRAINIYGGSNVYSQWTAYTSNISTVPKPVSGVKASAYEKDGVKVTWEKSATATSYSIEYTTKKAYFDTSSNVQSTQPVEKNSDIITGLDSGETWFFRVKAMNDGGDSEWSSIVSTVIGTEPEAPTTWSLTSTANVGEEITLYWTHNSEDGSKQSGAQIYISINGDAETYTPPVNSETDEDDDEPVYSYTFGTKAYTSGATIRWRVRTSGVKVNDEGKPVYGPWSTTRTIKLYAEPNLAMTVKGVDEGTLTELPIKIELEAGPTSQKPISYHVAITAKKGYKTVDADGNDRIVIAGSEVYSKTLITSNRSPIITVSAGDIILENNKKYTLTATVAMDSGRSAKRSMTFDVDWKEFKLVPDASIAKDLDTLCAYIAPFCRDVDGTFARDVTMSVYRREYDGSFKEIATDIPNDGSTGVTDPHPALDYARYRIVAVDGATSGVVYEDLPGEPIGETAIVIQWDETWSKTIEYFEEDEPETTPWIGSMVKIPYNVDVNESQNGDVALIEYIGREHPVSYYGTQKGVTASWSAEIPKSDKETLYALRRLQAWRGDVYVREPSGTGYWANVKVSFPLKHLALTVPVTFDITRVEGGV